MNPNFTCSKFQHGGPDGCCCPQNASTNPVASQVSSNPPASLSEACEGGWRDDFGDITEPSEEERFAAMNSYQIVPLPGSDGKWEAAWKLGDALEKAFPDQDAGELCTAIEYNGAVDDVDQYGISALVMIEEGERDEASWAWNVTTGNGKKWVATGGCDYTGWDCQSWMNWESVEEFPQDSVESASD